MALIRVRSFLRKKPKGRGYVRVKSFTRRSRIFCWLCMQEWTLPKGASKLLSLVEDPMKVLEKVADCCKSPRVDWDHLPRTIFPSGKPWCPPPRKKAREFDLRKIEKAVYDTLRDSIKKKI